jgi:hypothetical protein
MSSADVDGEDDNGVWSRGNGREGLDNSAGEAKSPRRLDCGLANHTGMWSLRRIIGGHPTQKGRWPWQVAILNRFKVLGHLMPACSDFININQRLRMLESICFPSFRLGTFKNSDTCVINYC